MFYTYLWLREDGTPYYVGKGLGNRAFTNKDHRVKRPEDRDRIILQYFPSEADAFEAERFLIRYYGRKDRGDGCLRNLTDGGDGVIGHRHSTETIEKIRSSLWGRNSGKRYTLGSKRSPETRQKMSELARVREAKKTPEERSAIARKRPPISEDTRRKQSLAKLGTKQSEETIRRRSESMKATLARKRNSPQGQE
jgi:NUMOD3 motif-containing protein